MDIHTYSLTFSFMFLLLLFGNKFNSAVLLVAGKTGALLTHKLNRVNKPDRLCGIPAREECIRAMQMHFVCIMHVEKEKPMECKQ